MQVTRRRFLAGAAGLGASAIIPESLLQWTRQAALATAGQPSYFLTPARMATCRAACARLVPTGVDPSTEPGATEAHAAEFIDRFLAAFELPASVADNPAIWLHGRYSGRNPYPNPQTGQPSSTSPPDQMLSPSGMGHYLPLTPTQTLVWRAQLYGAGTLTGAAGANATWAGQVAAGTIPGLVAGGLRQLYAAGLDAFDAYSRQMTGQPFATAPAVDQDIMLALAGNIALDSLGLPPPPVPITPPPAAQALFPTLLSNTFEACYCLPEYRGLDRNPLWDEIGFDGDTQPLGNSIYDENVAGPGQGPNAGFGESGVYLPRGGYRQFRPVS